MKHIFQQGNHPEAPTLLLLHGTGGTEEDLLAVGRFISEGSSLLGVRGNVLENGMPRFFRRIREGVFDEEDLLFRTNELHGFLNEAADQYGFDRNNVVAVGYSNGANMAASLLFHYEKALKGAVLFHPMVPRRGIDLPDLSGVFVFIGAGKNDPICAPKQSEELAKRLESAQATVSTNWYHNGHQLTEMEVRDASEWFKQTF